MLTENHIGSCLKLPGHFQPRFFMHASRLCVLLFTQHPGERWSHFFLHTGQPCYLTISTSACRSRVCCPLSGLFRSVAFALLIFFSTLEQTHHKNSREKHANQNEMKDSCFCSTSSTWGNFANVQIVHESKCSLFTPMTVILHFTPALLIVIMLVLFVLIAGLQCFKVMLVSIFIRTSFR